MGSVSEEEADHWSTRTLIAFREPPIPGLPPEGRNFGTTGGVTPKAIVVGLRTGRAVLTIGPALP